MKFMTGDRESDLTIASGAILADGGGIWTVLCAVRTPHMNAIAGSGIAG